MNTNISWESFKNEDPARSIEPNSQYVWKQIQSRVEDDSKSDVVMLKSRSGKFHRYLIAASVAAAVLVVPVVSSHDTKPISPAAAAAIKKLNKSALAVMQEETPTTGYFMLTTNQKERNRESLHILVYSVDFEGDFWIKTTDSGGSPQLQKVLASQRLNREGNWQSPTNEFLAGLPTNVEDLRNRLYDDVQGFGSDPDSEAFVYITDLMRARAIDGDLRGLLLQVLGTIPNVDVYMIDETHVGIRAATRPDLNLVEEVSIDTNTGTISGEKTIKNGKVTYSSTQEITYLEELPAEFLEAKVYPS